MSTPRIALVHDWLATYAGGEQVLKAMHELYPEAPIFTSVWNPEAVSVFPEKLIHTSYLQQIPGAKTHHQILAPLMPQAFESFDLKGFDVVLSSTTGMAKGVITHPGQTHISYCHTPPRYLWRLGGDNRSSSSWLRSYVSHGLRLWDVVSAERVDQFVANSQTVADRIAKIYHKPSTVIYPPVDTEKFAGLESKDGGYFITVSRLIAYKRIDLIIEACKKLGKRLVVVGDGPERANLERLAEGGDIRFVGRVSDQRLAELYTEATAFLFAAEEDFGIVPVEAMSAGKPVIAFGKGGLTESVIAGKTGAFFSEQTSESLIATLKSTSFADFETAVIKRHAKTFDTAVFKEKIGELVSKAASR